jgi:hypothetical protein
MATESDRVNTGALGTIAAVGALALLGIAAALTALVRHQEDQLTVEHSTTANLRPFSELKKEQHSTLVSSPAWVDRNKQRVSIPIERAMQLVVTDIQQDPNSATPPPPDAGAPEQPEQTQPEEQPDAGADGMTGERQGPNGDKALQGKAQDQPVGEQRKPVLPQNDQPQPDKAPAPTGAGDTGGGAPEKNAP